MNTIDVALICKALSDSNRLQIISLLSDKEKCACKLLERFKITQPTLSHHMKVLCDCGLVNSRKEGKWSYYSLNYDTMNGFRDYIGNLSCCVAACGSAASCNADGCCNTEKGHTCK